MSVNQVLLIGRLGHDAKEELKVLPDGKAVAKLRLAVKRPVKNSEGINTDWIKCEFWNKKAEVLSQYAQKGDLISISGSLRIDLWEKDGIKHHAAYVLGKDFQFLSSPREREKKSEAIAA